ncbi:MAG: ATP-binding cassette domain-containing protein, partial [Planctomycetota bacterium]
MTQALEVRALRFGYGRSESVHDVSLSLATGDCYGFLGHNGAGKTTVLRLCLGLLSPRSGSVHIHGIDALRSPREARALLGAMVERPGFHLQATALQNLASLARLQGMSRKIASTESWRVIELLSLKNAAGWPVGAFSLGMRQRLGIAQALLGKPRLLLLDEPTNGLDPEGIADLRALLRHLSRDEGTTVLLSSHQLQEIEGLCTRIGVLREGRMALEGNVEDLRREIPKRHIVQGTPMESMRARLIELGLAPISDGEQMLVDLGPRSAGTVARALTEIGELTAFSPESITLESIYLRATRIEEPVSTPKSSATQKAATTSDAQRIAVSPGFGTTKRPRFRAYRHEVHVLLRRPLTKVLLFLPAAFAAISVNTYRQQVGASLERVQAKEQFSADSGSGHLAVAHALLAAASVRYGRQVAFLGVDATDRDTASAARGFLATHPVSYPSYQAATGQLLSLAEIIGLPTTIFIDPGAGFGTGLHETTQLCLRALAAWISEGGRIERVLDFGSGSGILGIAAAVRGAAVVHSIEIDSLVHDAIRANADRNR